MIDVNQNPESCFESALFILPPTVHSYANKVTCPSYPQQEIEGLIDNDLMEEINKSCAKKSLKDITSSVQNKCKPDKNGKTRLQYAFPDGGWVCSLCKNYNFCGRLQCNRCCKRKEKDDSTGKPKHLQRFDGKYDKKKLSLSIREGDWNCPFCDNINFAFRTQCNKCLRGKDEVFNPLEAID